MKKMKMVITLFAFFTLATLTACSRSSEQLSAEDDIILHPGPQPENPGDYRIDPDERAMRNETLRIALQEDRNPSHRGPNTTHHIPDIAHNLFVEMLERGIYLNIEITNYRWNESPDINAYDLIQIMWLPHFPDERPPLINYLSESFNHYARNGYFADIFTLIQHDSLLTFDDFFVDVLVGSMCNGGLHRWPLAFGIMRVTTDPFVEFPDWFNEHFNALEYISMTQMLQLYEELMDYDHSRFGHLQLGMYSHETEAHSHSISRPLYYRLPLYGVYNYGDNLPALAAYLNLANQVFARTPYWTNNTAFMGYAVFFIEWLPQQILLEQRHVIPLVASGGELIAYTSYRVPEFAITSRGNTTMAWEMLQRLTPATENFTHGIFGNGREVQVHIRRTDAAAQLSQLITTSLSTRVRMQPGSDNTFVLPPEWATRRNAEVARILPLLDMPMRVVRTHPTDIIATYMPIIDWLRDGFITPAQAAQQLMEVFLG